MRSIGQILMALLSCCALGQQPVKVSALPNAEFRKEFMASEKTLLIEHKDLQVRLAKGESRYVRVFAIHDSSEHLLWWLPMSWPAAPAPEDLSDRTDAFLEGHSVKVVPGRIVVFWPMPYPFSLKILSSAVKCGSEKECWDLVYRELNDRLPPNDSELEPGAVTINLEKLFGRDFTIKKQDRMNAGAGIYMPKIDSVNFAASEWEIRVESPDKDIGVLTLNDEFKVTKASVLEKTSGSDQAKPE
jgi:hypothetical protein